MKKVAIVFICILLFFITAPLFITFNLQLIVGSSPQTIKKILIDIDAYQRLRTIKATDLMILIQPEARDESSQISEEAIQQTIDAITPEMMQRLVEGGLDSFYTSLSEGKSSFSVDLAEVKAVILSNQSQKELSDELNKVIPDVYTVNFPEQSTSAYNLINSNIIKYSGLIIFFLLMIVAILLSSGAKNKLITSGSIFLIIAFNLLIIHYLSIKIPFEEIKTQDNNAVSQEVINVLRDFVQNLWQIVSLNLRNQGFISLAVSVVLFIISIAIPSCKISTITTNKMVSAKVDGANI